MLIFENRLTLIGIQSQTKNKKSKRAGRGKMHEMYYCNSIKGCQ